MELQNSVGQSAKIYNWGYRELTASELLMVGGGEGEGDGAESSCDAGGSCESSDHSPEVASLGCNIVGGLVGVAVGRVGGAAAGAIAGALALEACERATS